MILMLKTISIAIQICNPNLLGAVCYVESNYRNVINHNDGGSASYGICQIKLKTANWMNEKHKILGQPVTKFDLMNPEINALFAGLYLKYQLDRYNGDIECAISGYNAGRCIKSNQSTYVKKVLRRMSKL